MDLILNYQNLENKGYNKEFLNQSLHSMLTLPFFLFLMTAIASILTMNTLKKSDNLKFIVLGLVISVLVYYFKDLSLALGQTERIPLILAIWAPVITLSFFIFIEFCKLMRNKILFSTLFFFIVFHYLLKIYLFSQKMFL